MEIEVKKHYYEAEYFMFLICNIILGRVVLALIKWVTTVVGHIIAAPEHRPREKSQGWENLSKESGLFLAWEISELASIHVRW